MNKSWNIIPIKKNTKIPAVKWLKYREEKFPIEDFQYYDGLNKAVICGKTSDNLVILDFDFEGEPYLDNILKILKPFKTFMVDTPHGLHVYFRINGDCPERQTQIKAKLPELKHFDILAEGGYALTPPSVINDEFYMERNHYPARKVDREYFDKIVEIFRQKKSDDKSLIVLELNLNKLRNPIQQLIKGEIDIEEIAAQTGTKEFNYWKAVFLETRANDIPDETTMGLLAGSQKHFDSKKTTTQLRQLKAWEKPYTNLTLNKMFDIKPDPPDSKLEEAWVSIARDLIDTREIITMKDTEQLMVKRGNIYSYDISGAIHELSDQLIDIYKGRSYDHKRRAVLRLIKDITVFDRKDFCYDRWVINFKNGHYDIKGGKFIESKDNIDKVFCYEIPHEYNPIFKGDCSYFKQLLIEWLEEDNIVKPDDIFEMIGYTMTMTTHLKMAFMIYGKSNTGKTAFQNILSNLIGIDNISQNTLERLGSNEFGTDNLEYKILNMCGDMGEGMIKDVSVFKNLTGGDIWIKAEYKGGKKFSFRNMLKIWYNLNYIPMVVNKHDEAFFNRWTLINFAHEFPMGDKETIKEIWTMVNDNPDEIQGIIHEAIKGLKRLLNRNEFFRPELIDNTRHIWEYESDPLYAFMYDNCLEIETETISSNEFRMAYNKFLYKKKRPQISAYKLGEMLETKGIFKERDTTNERGYYYKGMGWKPKNILAQRIIG